MLRRRNTNSSLGIAYRSHAAQASIDKYAPQPPPKSDSLDVLQADQVYTLTAAQLTAINTVEGWLPELERLRTVVASPLLRTGRSTSADRTDQPARTRRRDERATSRIRSSPAAIDARRAGAMRCTTS
jgi:hypothetical protein